MNDKEINLAYIAEFFDGEENITIDEFKPRKFGWNKTYLLRIRLVNTNEEVIKYCKNYFKVERICFEKRNKKRKGIWRWIVCTRQVEEVLKKLLPYLKVKKRQAELAIRFQEMQRIMNKNRKMKKGRINNKIFSYSKEEIEEKEKLKNEVLQFNKRGQGEPSKC